MQIIVKLLLFISSITLFCVSATAIDYAYDDSGRISAVTYDDGSTMTFSYDAAGNLLTKTMTRVTAGPLAAAILPASRSTQVGVPVTAFTTIINAGSVDALNCGLNLLSERQISYLVFRRRMRRTR